MTVDPDWKSAYADMTNPFGAKGPFYDGLGHRGADYRRGAGQTVPAYAAGVIGEVEANTSGLGGIVGVAFDDGGSAGWAHLAGIAVRIGDRVEPGTVLGYASGGGASAGALWDGAHIHTTRRTDGNAVAAARGIRPLVDPVPYIDEALASTAGADDLQPLIEPEEAEMILYINTEVESPWFVGGPGIWRQVPPGYGGNAQEAWPTRWVSNVAFDLARKVCLGESFG